MQKRDGWDVGAGRLRALVRYGRQVYDLRERFAGVRDRRRVPRTKPPQVAAAIFFTGLLRFRSFNALEPRLREKPFLQLLGSRPEMRRLCSVDTLSRALRGTDLETVRAISVGILRQAERNKVFREGWLGTLRYVAVDAWEPFASQRQHCPRCLVRRLKFKQADGSILEVPEYYHRYVVAMLLGPRFDLVLDYEPLLPHALRPAGMAKHGEDEGEQTAAERLLWRVKRTFPWVDVVVGDSLYANGRFLSVVKDLRMGAVIIDRRDTDEPLREALVLWENQPPERVVDDASGERLELWDCRDLTTLETYSGPIRVVRGRVGRDSDKTQTWCVLVTGIATRLSSQQILAVARGRWHIENTGFHQWTTRWRFDHVFVHDDQGIRALYWLFFAAFNLLTLFLYQQVRSYGRDRGRDPTRTISRLIDEMVDDLARLDASPWDSS